MLSAQNLIRGSDDGVCELPVESSRFLVGYGGRSFDANRGIHERGQRLQTADRKVLNGTQSLNAIESIRRYFELAEGVFFDSSDGGHCDLPVQAPTIFAAPLKNGLEIFSRPIDVISPCPE